MELNKSQSIVWGSLQIHLMCYQFCIIDFQDLRMVKTDYHILFLLTIIDIYIYIYITWCANNLFTLKKKNHFKNNTCITHDIFLSKQLMKLSWMGQFE